MRNLIDKLLFDIAFRNLDFRKIPVWQSIGLVDYCISAELWFFEREENVGE